MEYIREQDTFRDIEWIGWIGVINGFGRRTRGQLSPLH